MTHSNSFFLVSELEVLDYIPGRSSVGTCAFNWPLHRWYSVVLGCIQLYSVVLGCTMETKPKGFRGGFGWAGVGVITHITRLRVLPTRVQSRCNSSSQNIAEHTVRSSVLLLQIALIIYLVSKIPGVHLEGYESSGDRDKMRMFMDL